MLMKKVFSVSRLVKDNRTQDDVLKTVVEEVGELSTELAIKTGFKNRAPGKDGVIGEAIDGIIALFDVIYLENPNLSEEELLSIADKKLLKWYEDKTK